MNDEVYTRDPVVMGVSDPYETFAFNDLGSGLDDVDIKAITPGL